MASTKYPRLNRDEEDLNKILEAFEAELGVDTQPSSGGTYPTQDEKERYRELKAKYRFRDAIVVKGVIGKYDLPGMRSAR